MVKCSIGAKHLPNDLLLIKEVIPMENMLNIDWLKSNHKLIHYFGLGFIQVKISDSTRFHFYTKELPAIVGDEEIHDHRYSFSSHVLRGGLHHSIYTLTESDSGDHLLEQESCQVNDLDHKFADPKKCNVKLISNNYYVAGSYYYLDHETLHQVKSDYAVTYLMKKSTTYEKQFANVVRPIGAEKVCPFSQQISSDRLWQIVEQMVKK